MTRRLAGVFDPSARADSSRLPGALAPHAATIAEHGPLQVAYSGEPSHERAPLCLLDGFLDNAAELASALDCQGATGEQLLAAGWRRWGPELPARMRGDFALLVWDEEHGEGLLARDQLGVRSLYLHEASGALCFASEVRHLLALLPRRPAPDPVSVAHWITTSSRPGATTGGAYQSEPKDGQMPSKLPLRPRSITRSSPSTPRARLAPSPSRSRGSAALV